MTGLLRALAGLLGSLPPLAVIHVEHVGDIHQHLEVDDDECDCGDCDCDPDAPAPDTYRIDEAALASLFEDVAIARGNGASNTEAVQQVMNSLVLRGIEIDAEDEL